MIHLNINSIQNKFDELKLLNRGLKSQIIIPSEMKIDSSYKSDQFRPQAYQMYRKERSRKEVADLLRTFISSTIASKIVKTPTFKHVEVLTIEMMIKDLLLLKAYRP